MNIDYFFCELFPLTWIVRLRSAVGMKMCTIVNRFVPEFRKLNSFFQGNCSKHSSNRRRPVLKSSHCVLWKTFWTSVIAAFKVQLRDRPHSHFPHRKPLPIIGRMLPRHSEGVFRQRQRDKSSMQMTWDKQEKPKSVCGG